jgi:hypothetical protein
MEVLPTCCEVHESFILLWVEFYKQRMSKHITKEVPIFEVNLDKPPFERWDHVLPHFYEIIPQYNDFIDLNLKQEFGCLHHFVRLFLTILSFFSFLFDQEYVQELQGISKKTEKYGISFVQLFQLNLAYDLIARCTSIATKSGSEIYHLRTMDWSDHKDLLRKLTIQVHYLKDKKVVFKSTQWVGMVGTFTGAKLNDHDSFGLSINFRKVAQRFSSVIGAICFLMDRKPLSFRIRKYFQYFPSARSVVKDVQTSWYSAPFYLLVSSASEQSTLITRGFFDSQVFQSDHIVQSNIDQNKRVCDPEWAGEDPLLNNSIERRDKGYHLLQEIEDELLTLTTETKKLNLYYKKILQSDPILSPDGFTIFTTMICLSQRVLYVSYTNWEE